MPNTSEVLNVHQAAAFLGAHAQTIRKLARSGALPAFKVGKDWRFRRTALLQWADEQQPAARAATSVLVVDDDELVCKASARLLTRSGCRVRYTTSARVGLDRVAEAVPDVILLDLVMPDMDGPQFLAELRRTHPRLPVIIITGHPRSELMAKASSFAPIMLLTKPVDPELLDRTVSALVGPTTLKEKRA